MSYIELKNDKYETLEDLKRLLQYILRLDKTAEDSQRVNTITNTLAGCQPAMIPNEYLCDPSAVYHLMLFEVRRRHKGIPQFAKHRIVSFAATDCILPQDVVSLAERIASIYAKNGYITAYGIHADSLKMRLFTSFMACSFMLLPAPSCRLCRSWGCPLRCAGTGSRCIFWSCGEGLRG